MSVQILVYIALGLSILSLFLGIYAVISSRGPRSWRKIFSADSNAENLEEIIDSIAIKIKNLETETDSAAASLQTIANQLNTATQHVGLIRYNSNGDDGGNLSFSAALLDAHQTGIVLTSLHGRQNNRIYAKVISQGASEQVLSDEEKEALIQAITRTNPQSNQQKKLKTKK